MSNLLLIFTVLFVVTIAAACGVGALVMLHSLNSRDDPPWRKRRMAARSTSAHHVFKDLR